MTTLVTGSTGLVGSAVVRALAAHGERVLATARNAGKAERLFAGLPGVEIAAWDVLRPAEIPGDVDYIVHAAAETASRSMVERPVETMSVTVDGTRHALELAREKRAKGMVFLSSMEVYGAPQEDVLLTESAIGPLDPLAPRSSYPLAKRMAEGLCAAFAREHGVPVRIARLAQVIGETVSEDDHRVIAQFARAVRAGEDLVLRTDGSSARCYCAVADAVRAILLLLERGVSGTAYNVADASSYCSIRELAERLCAAHPPSKVVIDPIPGMGYAPACKLRLSTLRLEALGWTAQVGLDEAFGRLLSSTEK